MPQSPRLRNPAFGRAGAGDGRRPRSFLAAFIKASIALAMAAVTVPVPVFAATPASTSPSPSSLGNYGSATVTVDTLTGADQYATAVAISQNLFPAGNAPVVYLVSGSTYAAALAAAPAAAHDGGVILYTANAALPTVVADELVRLTPDRVEIVGGTPVIGDSVLAQAVALLDPATVVERVAGSDAYGTAATLSAQSFQPNSGSTYHAIAPKRVLDSRLSLGAKKFLSRVKQSFAVGGLPNIPADAVAVTGNVTVTGQTIAGYVTVAPSLVSGVTPSTSTINFPAGDVRANGLTVSLGLGGKLDAIYWTGGTKATTDLVFDVTGYYADDSTGATFNAIAPGRVLDSRLPRGATLFHSMVKQSFAVGGLFGVPLDAVAVTGTVTITGQTRAGYVTVAPSLTSGVKASTSTINFPARDVRANGLTVPLGDGGKLQAMYASSRTTDTVQIVFDVTGYYASGLGGASFHAITPKRVLDSRLPLGATTFHGAVKQSFAVSGSLAIPSGAVAVAGNVTITGQTQAGYLTVAPGLTSGVKPSTSTINFPRGDVRASGMTVQLGSGGKLDAIYIAGSTSAAETVGVVFDVTGYFAIDPPGAPDHSTATVVIASAESYADAVLAGSVAAELGVPFLLVSHNSLPAATSAELSRLRPRHGIVVGSAASVSDAVLAGISTLAPTVERVAGADSYGSAALVATRFFPHATTVIATTGLSYTNGLAGVPLSAVRAAPILFVQMGDLLPVATRDALVSLRPTGLVFAGGISPINGAELVGFSDGRLTRPTDTTTYPSYDSGYHDPGELYTVIKAEEIAYPTLVQIFSIGKSYQGRDIWAARVTGDVTVDADKPETMVDALHHSDEHLGVEQALYLLETLTSGYGTDTLVTSLVDERVTWIIFAVNPDGWRSDLAGGVYHSWRKNMQVIPDPYYAYLGVDINRNYGYKWGCCGGSSTSQFAWNYHGTGPFSTPEAQAVRNFVNSRFIGGKQRIETQVSLHTDGGLVLYPYAYTKTALPSDMTADDHATFVQMAQTMAGMNGYTAEQSSSLYLTDGDEIDWLYHTYGIFSFTMELYPGGTGGDAAYASDSAASAPAPSPATVYPPFSAAAAETARNRSALLYLINIAACPYSAIGKSAQYCPGAPGIIPTTAQ